MGPPVFHPRIPPAVLTRSCPMRALRDPAVGQFLPLWLAWRRFQALPDPGGYLDQDAQTMAALDAMEASALLDPPDPTAPGSAARPDPRPPVRPPRRMRSRG